MGKAAEILMITDSSANLKHYAETYANWSWDDVDQVFTWSKTGRVNIVHEAVDRHVEEGFGDQIALLYTDGQGRDEQYTFADMSRLSSQFANGLKKLNIKKGDRVFIFMPRCPEVYVAMLGIVRIGAIAGPLFEAFMEAAVKDRLEDSGAVAVVTTPELVGRIPAAELPALKHIILVGAQETTSPNQVLYEDLMQVSGEHTIEWVDRESGMLLHYTSGSTGKPKGVLHVHDAMRHQYVSGKFAYDLREGDIYWCTADPGWVTGTSAGIWAPWLNRVTVVLRGGRFKPEDWYATLEKFKVTVWFSAPTAFRMLMGAGDELPKRYDLSHLRHILSAGEPLNPEVIRWGLDILGLRIHDNWWMTETGSTICSNYPSMPIRPGSMGKLLPGIQKYNQYFKNGWYISGDMAYKDEDGYFWFSGRVDDVINTSGERVGPFEVESKLVEHPAVAEAGVIGIPDEVR
ncbi:acetate--CoA ligase [Caldalkalibacillus thermarum]|uniref:AMP-binding protein n=1 Tax=Caldalkalibacillus thermarum TaxID=296745 RepID=UPI00198E11ED|nr:AMP-binding protein [Caldalkalibacillus thermarum]GGK20830.1 acetate--CoA ligase [Caldalkalibacillus thermarum]